MATEAQIKTMLQNAVGFLAFERVNAATSVTKAQTFEAALAGDDVPDAESAVRGYRSSKDGVLSQGASVLAPILASYARVLSTNDPKVDPASALVAIYNQWMTTGDRVTSRQWSRGAPAAGGSNVGNGTIRRLNLDERGINVETGFAETKTFTCTTDQNTGGNKHEEVFTCQGQTAARDGLTVAGSGLTVPLAAVSARNSLLGNASFSQFSGTIAAPTAITNWTPGTALTNFQLDQTNFYRGFPGDTTPTSVIFLANDNLSQALSVRRTGLALPQPGPNLGNPYYLQVAFNAQVAGANGTLTIALGTQSTSVVVTGLVGWQLLFIPIDKRLWYRNFSQDNLSVTITVSGGTIFGLRVDDVLLVPWTKVDTTWWLAVGGATAFSAGAGGDTFTTVDTTAADSTSRIENELWRGFQSYEPAAYPSPTGAATAAVGAAGNVNAGTHSYKYTWVDATGAGESGGSPVSNQVNPGVASQVSLTGVTVGPNGTTKRNVYRTVAGDVGAYKLVGSIADNTTTTFTDNVADASLGATIPTGVTVAEPPA